MKNVVAHFSSIGVTLGVLWYVWGHYGFWWGIWYGLNWQAWMGYRLAAWLLS